MNETLICPYTKNCIVYQNWYLEMKDKRINIIHKNSERYECLAKIAVEDPVTEGGICYGREIEERLIDRESECSWIESLNNQQEILGLVKKLAK